MTPKVRSGKIKTTSDAIVNKIGKAQGDAEVVFKNCSKDSRFPSFFGASSALGAGEGIAKKSQSFFRGGPKGGE